MPPAPKLEPGPWLGTFAATMTAWAGPWGVSFTANLTPDKETGLGKWTAQTFVDTIRSGRIMGKGRPMLPPMPFEAMRNSTDDDLKAIFAYLAAIPVVVNKIPRARPAAGHAENGRHAADGALTRTVCQENLCALRAFAVSLPAAPLPC
jgi:hypothetical protein